MVTWVLYFIYISTACSPDPGRIVFAEQASRRAMCKLVTCVHACRRETALGCTMWEAGWGSFACFTCFACCVFQYRYILYMPPSAEPRSQGAPCSRDHHTVTVRGACTFSTASAPMAPAVHDLTSRGIICCTALQP
jgi:hypothetical protein